MKVDFLIIGAARSATTSVSEILASHPSVSFSRPKEPQFFSKENWRDTLDAYHKLFKKREGVLYGEGSTNYTKFPFFNKNIHDDIFEYNPEIKLLYIVRNPIERIKSHYKFALERGYTTDTIDTAIRTNSVYTDASKYYMQIAPYIEVFGAGSVKIILFEDFATNPQQVMNEICDFLEINSIDLSSKKTHFNQTKKGKIGLAKYDYPKSALGYLKKISHYLKRRFFNKQAPKYSVEISEATLETIKSPINDDIEKLEILLKKELMHWKI